MTKVDSEYDISKAYIYNSIYIYIEGAFGAAMFVWPCSFRCWLVITPQQPRHIYLTNCNRYLALTINVYSYNLIRTRLLKKFRTSRTAADISF